MERLFLESALRVALLVAGTAIVLHLMRIKDAAAKHRIWAGVVLVMLVLPIWTAWGPEAPLPVLPPLNERTTSQAPPTGDALSSKHAERRPGPPDIGPDRPERRV